MLGKELWLVKNYGPDCHVQLCSSGRHLKDDSRCLNVLMDMLPFPTSNSDGSNRFRILQERGCDVSYRPQGYLLPEFHSSIFFTISQCLPVHGTLVRPFHSPKGLH